MSLHHPLSPEYHRHNQCRGYEERKEKRLHAFTAGPSTQYRRNVARRGSSTSTAKTITPPVTSTETRMETTDETSSGTEYVEKSRDRINQVDIKRSKSWQ